MMEITPIPVNENTTIASLPISVTGVTSPKPTVESEAAVR